MEKITKIEDIDVNDFVKVEDVSGGVVAERLNFSGQVFNKHGNIIEVKTFDGTYGIKWDDDVFETVWYKLEKKPAGWDKFIKNPKKFKSQKNVPLPSKLVKTKKELVFDLVKANPRKKLSGLLKIAKNDIGGEDSLLTTYIQLAISKFR